MQHQLQKSVTDTLGWFAESISLTHCGILDMVGAMSMWNCDCYPTAKSPKHLLRCDGEDDSGLVIGADFKNSKAAVPSADQMYKGKEAKT